MVKIQTIDHFIFNSWRARRTKKNAWIKVENRFLLEANVIESNRKKLMANDGFKKKKTVFLAVCVLYEFRYIIFVKLKIKIGLLRSTHSTVVV